MMDILFVIMLSSIDNIIGEALLEERNRLLEKIAGKIEMSKEELIELIGEPETYTNNVSPTKTKASKVEGHSLCKRGKYKPSIPLPYCGTVQDEWCKAIRVNHGLFTQCTNSIRNKQIYCKTCQKHVKDGIPQYGNIYDRGQKEWKSPTGRTPISYSVVMVKQGLEIKQVEEEAKKLGWTLPEITEPEIIRGRPKKIKKVLVNSTGNALIANLIATARRSDHENTTLLKTDFEKKIEGAIPVSVQQLEGGKEVLVAESGTTYDIETQQVLNASDDTGKN